MFRCTAFIDWRPAKARLGQLLGDRRGVAAIEFALLAPVMIMLYVGTLDVGDALTIDRRTDQVAYTAADLVAQVKTISTSGLDDVMDAATSILAPYSTAPLSIVLTSVVADSKNKTTVAWSCARNARAYAEDATFTLPDGLTEAGSSVIVAQVEYAYEPMIVSDFVPGFKGFTMSRTFYTRPRRSLEVDKSDSGSCS